MNPKNLDQIGAQITAIIFWCIIIPLALLGELKDRLASNKSRDNWEKTSQGRLIRKE